jgi:hypothetical protein
VSRPALSAWIGALVLIVMFAVPVDAAVSPCAGQATSHFAGGSTSYQLNIWGSKANISDFDPALCGSSSVSVAWSMVAAVSNDAQNAHGWAQIGYGEFGGNSGFSHSGYHTFSQFTKWCYDDGSACASGYPVTKFDPAPTSTVLYKNQYRSADSHIHMYYGSTQLDETEFDPTNNHWDGNWSAQFFDETYHQETDVVGKDANRVQYTSLMKQTDNSGGNWAGIQNITRRVDYSRYHAQFTNPTQNQNFETWTKPLNSL